MVTTRNQELSTEEGSKPEQPEQTETTISEDPTPSEPNGGKKEDDAASKARDRQARFKALQARAVSKHSCPEALLYLRSIIILTLHRNLPRNAT